MTDPLTCRSNPSDTPAIIDPDSGGALYYNQFISRVNGAVNFLRSRGLSDSSKVVIAGVQSLSFGLIYASLSCLGCDSFVLDGKLPTESFEAVCHSYKPDALVIVSDVEKTNNCYEEIIGNEIRLFESRSILENSCSHGQPSPPSFSHEHRLLLQTSGTTGEPKRVGLSRTNLRASAEASAKRLGVRERDLWLNPLPTHHMGGMAPIVRSLRYGTGYLPAGYNPERILELVEHYPVTGVSLVPTMLRDILDTSSGPVLEELRFVLVGGADTPVELRQRAAQREVPIYPTYGMTEAGSQIATATPREAVKHPTSTGKPIPGMEVTIDKESSGTSSDEGEILINGPMVVDGYENDTREPRSSFTDDGFRTGDLGYFDDENRLYVTGRLDRLINRGGEIIDPAGIEEALNRLSYVRNCHVMGLEDERLGERIAAFVRTDNTRKLKGETIAKTLSESVADSMLPDDFYFVEKLPRTESGTIDAVQLRARAQ